MTARTKVRAAAARKPPAPRVPPAPGSNVCACGCGGATRSTFCVGHDARHKSALVKEAKAGSASARAELEQRNWLHFLDKSLAAQVRQVQRRDPAIAALERADRRLNEEERAHVELRILSDMKRAAIMLRQCDRYHRSAADRYIEVTRENYTSILARSHPALTDADIAAMEAVDA